MVTTPQQCQRRSSPGHPTPKRLSKFCRSSCGVSQPTSWFVNTFSARALSLPAAALHAAIFITMTHYPYRRVDPTASPSAPPAPRLRPPRRPRHLLVHELPPLRRAVLRHEHVHASLSVFTGPEPERRR